MKRYLYSFCLIVALSGLSACSKSNDPAPVSPVVGRWELKRGLLSGFPTSTNLNGRSIDLYYWESYGSTLDIYSDNTFNANFQQIFTGDAPGTWDFSNNNLNLKYDAGDQETYTYSKDKNIEELALSPVVDYTVPISSTATADGKMQLIYRK